MDIQESESSKLIKRVDIFHIWRQMKKVNNSTKHQETYEGFRRTFNLEDDSHHRDRVHYLCKAFLSRWIKCGRREVSFLEKYGDWLDVFENFDATSVPTPPAGGKSRGRPRKAFSACSSRTKRRRLQSLASLDETLAHDLRATQTTTVEPTCLHVNDAVSLLVEAKLTKNQYQLIKNVVAEKTNLDIFPSYAKILQAKKQSYPKAETITVTESSAEVTLQGLLDHTASRLVVSQEEVFAVIQEGDFSNLTLVGKWGFDGSSGQSEYKQKSSGEFSDSDMFMTSYVPLQLFIPAGPESEKKIVWQNPRPGSTRYCRPVRFQLKKETPELSKAEQEYIERQITLLTPTTLTAGGETVTVKHNLKLTMVDGKTCNALTSTSSSQVCYLCGAKPTQMNDIDASINRAVKEDGLDFGISPLHAWIRFFEFLLHVSYRLDFKKWRTGQEEKSLFAAKKERVQAEFKEKMGLIVDKPKQGGGTSNDGNTARRFFTNSSLSAEITRVNERIIERCGVILKVLSSGFEINAHAFEQYALQTAREIVDEYPWYPLPASVHKVLIHGTQIVRHAILPIGQLTEEAAEAKNKDVKSFRERNTRKTSRIATNQDLLNRLLLSSDPLITNKRPLPKKSNSCLNKVVLSLLL